MPTHEMFCLASVMFYLPRHFKRNHVNDDSRWDDWLQYIPVPSWSMLFLGVTCLEGDFERRDNVETLSCEAFNNLGYDFK